MLVVDGGGTYHDSLLKTTYGPCEQQTGIKIQSAQYDYSNGQILANEKGAKTWDVVTYAPGYANAVDTAALFQPLDYGVINTPGLTTGTKHKYYLDYVYSPDIIAYRTDKITGTPNDWASLWDVTKYPGTRNMYNTPIDTMTVALLADGVAPADLYPIDVTRALKKLDALIASTKVQWYPNGQTMIQNFTSGITPIGLSWLARTLKAKSQGAPLGYSTVQSVEQPTSWAVTSTAPHPNAAMAFIKCAAQAARQAADAVDFLGDVPANPLAFDLLDAQTKAAMPDATTAVITDTDYWNENFAAIFKTWSDWFATH